MSRVERCETSTADPGMEASRTSLTSRSRSSTATDVRTSRPLRNVSRIGTSSGAGVSPATGSNGAGAGRFSAPTLNLVQPSQRVRSAERRSRVKPPEALEICRLYEAGLTIHEVAHRIGRSFGTVHRHLHLAGVAVERPGVNRRPHPDRVPHAEIERTVELYESGLSTVEVGRRMYLSPAGVRRRLAVAGVPRRSRSEVSRLASQSRRLEPETERCLVVLYELRVPMAEIARWMGVHRDTVTRVAKRNGVALRRRPPSKPTGIKPTLIQESAKVDNAPLRQAFEDSGRTATEVAEWCGWLQRGSADTSRVKRVLGIQPESSKGRRYFRRELRSDMAALVASALGLDPWEVPGL